MRIPYLAKEIQIPDNVKVTVSDGKVVVRGSLGALEREFKNLPVIIRVQDNKVVVESWFCNREQKALVGTVAAHIRNMMLGVSRGWRYKLKIVYSHFPMSVKLLERERKLIIENFLGRRDKLVVDVPDGVKVQVLKDDIIVEGIDIDVVSQFASRVEQITTLRGDEGPCVHGRERGPGVLDGIYVYKVEHMK